MKCLNDSAELPGFSLQKIGKQDGPKALPLSVLQTGETHKRLVIRWTDVSSWNRFFLAFTNMSQSVMDISFCGWNLRSGRRREILLVAC